MSVADALVDLLPVATADRLAGHLTAGDVETLRDLVRASVPDNTVRAVVSDLAYLEAWHRAARGAPLAWPPADGDGLAFIAHHLFRAEERAVRGDGYGMPAAVEAALVAEGMLRTTLPHAPATVARRLASWRRIAQLRGFDAALSSITVRRTLAAARKAADRPRQRHSETAVTRALLDRMIGADPLPGDALSLRELRDRTLLLVAFATGGRRRSELGLLRLERVVRLEQDGARGAALVDAPAQAAHGLAIILGRTKTTSAEDDTFLVVTGRAQAHLEAWIAALGAVRPGTREGPIFRAIDRWGAVGEGALSGHAVNAIVKARAARAGIDAARVSAHGLRAGYLTEASLQGVPIEAAMRHSLHRSVQAAVRYYRDQERASGRAARLAG
ncbi:integrase [Acuticoccus sediminis]|uniref:Integrase n=1 Tax=Acuticoccus sediminis TaxID=2184697 RepID=A0A8B2NCY4_9HYPH|nr:integrase [Acuticoccus sediminis]RAH96230.1 integrase [Acuticoccus sediminis]